MKMIHEQASRKITFLKNNVWLNIFNKKKVCNKFDTKDCNKFDKVILRNSWRHIMVPGHIDCQSGSLNILEGVDYTIFHTLTGVWYRSFSRLSFRQFLWIHSGTLQGKLPLSLSPPLAPSLPTPCHWPPLPAWGINFLSEICSFCPPWTQTPLTSLQGDPKSPAGP